MALFESDLNSLFFVSGQLTVSMLIWRTTTELGIMVYCGKPTKGCANCRKRRIRVSGKPFLYTAYARIRNPNEPPRLSGSEPSPLDAVQLIIRPQYFSYPINR